MATSRRNFLKWMGAFAAGAACTDPARAGLGAAPSPQWWGMLTDLTLCIGCRKCEFACKDANGLPNQPIEAFEDTSVFEQKRRTDNENATVVNRYPSSQAAAKPTYVKSQCMHCHEPACASACPVRAIRKTREGPVVYDPANCIGCRYCLMACPFSIPTYTYDNPYTPVVRKCSMCFDKVSGEGGMPACAKICPVEAITFGKRNDLLALAHDKIRNNPDTYVAHVYGEHEVAGTSWLYIGPRPFEEVGFRTDLGTTAYPDLTSGFLSIIPLVVTIWPVALLGAYVRTSHREQTVLAPAPLPSQQAGDGI